MIKYIFSLPAAGAGLVSESFGRRPAEQIQLFDAESGSAHQHSGNEASGIWPTTSLMLEPGVLQRAGWVADVCELWATEQLVSASSDANAANGDQNKEEIKYFGDFHQDIFF